MARRTASPKTATPVAAKPAVKRPSPKRDALVAQAEDLFDRLGFHGTGVDRLVTDSGVARMTFYKHFPTKNSLVRAVLERRDARFWAHMETEAAQRTEAGEHAVLAAFDALAAWLDGPGGNGDFLLKALGEFSEHDVTVAGDAAFRKLKAGPWMQARLDAVGVKESEARSWDLVLLMEGATALAPVVGGAAAASQARHAAAALLRAWEVVDAMV
ncbi:MAG: TetR/AcrR family transcriptional regulator [Rhodospirillaceae bacterium]